MKPAEPFTFEIALVSRRSAGERACVQDLLDLTLASLQGQTDQDFKVVIAGHERPRLPDDPRIGLLAADWSVEAPGLHNADIGRKHHAISGHVLHSGGGLLMFVDADDWTDVCTVQAARQSLFNAQASQQPGRACRRGAAGTDETAIAGNPLINHSENHSEVHGPHAQRRAEMTRAVKWQGGELSHGMARRFGLALARNRAVQHEDPQTHKGHEAGPQGVVV